MLAAAAVDLVLAAAEAAQVYWQIMEIQVELI
jgi:hypothetical protein